MTTPTSTGDAALRARKTWRTVEPLHGMIYFVPEAAEAYEALGITGRDGYFASRAAPMGAVTAEVVVATFYNFRPELVHAAVPAAWGAATPAQIVAARLDGVDRAMRRLLGDEVMASSDMKRAAGLARRAAEGAASRLEGRPLAAGHASLDWPDAPHLGLWHAQSILREFRGDGHVALLVAHDLSGLEALVVHAASGEVPASVLLATRGWTSDQWDTAVVALRTRGWLADGDLALSAWGSERRQEIEDATDALAAAPYALLGDDLCAELRSLVRPWSRIFADTVFR
ncbi:MAG: SCO6745 family protein [Acidimicrobiales bacterium]